MGAPPVALLVIAVVAFLVVAVLSAGEGALLRVTRGALADELALAEAKGTSARARVAKIRRAQALAAEPTVTVAALAVVRTTAQVVAVAAIAIALTRAFGSWWEIVVAAGVIGLVSALVMARISPRQAGFRRPVPVLLVLGGVLQAVRTLTGWAAPPAWLREGEPTEDEFLEMVDRVGDSEGIEEDERELIKSVFELGDTIAREVMVPRTEMVVVTRDATLRKALRLLLRSGYSRVPVIGDSVDDLVGIAYLKDVAELVDADPVAGDRLVASVTREAVFVPESKPVDDLLREMQASQSHIAIVVDEYGGIAGLVTIEDILEELVGELVDEHDSVPVVEVEQISPNVYRVPARLPVDELGELFDIRLDDDAVDTVGGLLAKALGKVPLAGSTAEIGSLRLVAERIQGRRKQVSTVLVTNLAAETNGN